MATRNAWKDREHDDHEPAKFGRKARAWLRRRIVATVFKPSKDPDCPYLDPNGCMWDSETIQHVLAWYLAEPLKYVEWVDTDEWRPGFYNGAWEFNAAAAKDVFDTASDAADRTLDAGRFETLDAWLKADIGDRLYYRGDPGGMDRVPAAMLPIRPRPIVPVRRPLAPRKCHTCNASFVPPKRNRINCDSCCHKLHPRPERPHRRVKCACGAVFEADRSNASRCGPCRDLARAERESR